ncbi:hypothetical protein JET68_01915 [Pseudomonas monteilii]|uniref:hypothetical protein n=1 Tax=Pseudomonas TaxID=286 RepID=UPI0018E6811F|nr:MULTISPECIES: hypothetical protein [Pseudomonas]MBI6917546.1 hypothetical protein [Pseudomonas monteilii]MCE0936458.1 hypothetical protein [Pseudomonas kurunegalensis]
MFFGLQEWESSTSAWRITAEEFSVFLKSRSPAIPGMTDYFKRQVQRWLGDNYLGFFNDLVDELVRMGTWAELDNKQSLKMIREAAMHFPKPPRFSNQTLDEMFERDLGL